MKRTNGLLAGTISFFLYVFMSSVFRLPMLVAAIGTVISFMVIWKLLDLMSNWGSPPPKEAPKYYKQLIKEGYVKLKRAERAIVHMRKSPLKLKAKETYFIAKDIFTTIEKNPDYAPLAREYFSYYLDAYVTSIEKFNELSNQRVTKEEFVSLSSKLDENLDGLKLQFDRQMKNLLSDQVMELDTDLDVMKHMLKTDGLPKVKEEEVEWNNTK
ncbi:hypothetical protein EJF36_03725 [Bacillus sp. HMF5848]|uniref:5-bromo-4-chloroindolyl phosphate hydrolysis family protein n=1 Tax=Bacillus sp. HMF5848 TaxID=2495421 RepID=UPI000F7BAB57|nr:5-bromo-4-chloroindolyl phosphate hydrolysis family protein [Bacillus sp. HMF5848]RSK26055.1 hypothetical protein EJF36_03725 [Bacillus sp. HMF5848]